MLLRPRGLAARSGCTGKGQQHNVPGHQQRPCRAGVRAAAADGSVDAAAVVEKVSDAVEAVAAPAAPAFKFSGELPSYEALTAPTKTAAATAAASADKAGDLAGAASKAAESLTAALSGATSGVGSTISGLTGGVSSTVSGLTGGVSSTVSGLTGGVSSTVSGLTSNLGKGASDVAGTVGSTLDTTLSSVKGGLEQVKGNLDQATAGVSGVVGDAVSTVTATTQAASEAVTSTLSGATAAVQQTVDAVSSQVTAVTTQVATTVDATTTQVLDSLPPPVKDAAVAVGGVLGAAAHAAVEHPAAAAVVTAAVAVPTAIRYYEGRYGGYAGELAPEQVSALLYNDNVFLIDIRPEKQREQDGLPELKLGARFKVAIFELPQVDIPSRVAREATNADELRLLVNAAYIAGLPQCQGQLTKMVVMDSTGSDKARELARALVALGQPLSYVLEGGFQSWIAAELPVVEGTEYDASTGAVIGDELEAIASKAGEVAATVSQPQVGLPLVGGTVLATYAALNYHTTLQFIGVLGVLLTITKKVTSYSSPREALDDVTGTFAAVSKTLGSLKVPSLKAPSLKAPSLPSLPKLPSLPGRGGAGAAAPAVPVTAMAGAGLSGDAVVDESGEGEQREEEQQQQPAAAAVQQQEEQQPTQP